MDACTYVCMMSCGYTLSSQLAMYFVCKMVMSIGQMLLMPVVPYALITVYIDAHSKLLEAHVVETPTLAGTIQKLCHMFATHGIPGTIMLTMDNVKHDSNVWPIATFWPCADVQCT